MAYPGYRRGAPAGGGYGAVPEYSVSAAEDDTVSLTFDSEVDSGAGVPTFDDDGAYYTDGGGDYAAFADDWAGAGDGYFDPEAYAGYGYDEYGGDEFAGDGYYVDPSMIEDFGGGDLGDLPALDFDVPEVPDQIAIPEFGLGKEVDDLQRQASFIILLHSKLVELQLETKLSFPALSVAKSTRIKELVGLEYDKVCEDNITLQRQVRELTEEVRVLREKGEAVDDLNAEVERLRKLTHGLDKKGKGKKGAKKGKKDDDADLRALDSEASHEYVREIETQLSKYRNKVQDLVEQCEAAKRALHETSSRLTLAREDLTSARDEMQKKSEMVDKAAMEAQEDELQRLRDAVRDQQAKYSSEIATLKDLLEKSKSDAAAAAAAGGGFGGLFTEEDRLRAELRQLQDEMGLMMAQKFQDEEESASKLKEQIESADQLRAKYESVKQHIRTMEAHNKEYTRVNAALKQQNDDFREMIVKLRKQLKAGGGGGAAGGAAKKAAPAGGAKKPIGGADKVDEKAPDSAAGGAAAAGGKASGGAGAAVGAYSSAFGKKFRSAVSASSSMIGRIGAGGKKDGAEAGAGAGAGAGASAAAAGGASAASSAAVKESSPPKAASAEPEKPSVDAGGAGADDGAPMSQEDFMREQLAAYAKLAGGGGGGSAPPAKKPAAPAKPPSRPAGGAPAVIGAKPAGDPLRPVPVQEIWGRKMKTISHKGSKKRVLVEWHFVTSDNMPHTIVLQHTQDSKAKTRRMLWVDGSEKYNNKSSASSFRIEIDKDVVVISIELSGSQYQYRLTINGMSYSESFQLWKSRTATS